MLRHSLPDCFDINILTSHHSAASATSAGPVRS